MTSLAVKCVMSKPRFERRTASITRWAITATRVHEASPIRAISSGCRLPTTTATIRPVVKTADDAIRMRF